MTDEPTLWMDMTRNQKADLLLAFYVEEKQIDYFNVYRKWQKCESGGKVPFADPRIAYRISPELLN